MEPRLEPDDLETRIAHAQARAQRLNEEIARLRAEQERAEQIRAEAQAARVPEIAENTQASLEEAVLRYAVACGAVDVQIALLRAQGTIGSSAGTPSEVLHNLSESLEEQSAASAVLRSLARTLRQARSGE